jgi:hypothetical protein
MLRILANRSRPGSINMRSRINLETARSQAVSLLRLLTGPVGLAFVR